MFNLFKKRTWDIAAVTDKTVKVKDNNQAIPIKTFENYIDLYIQKVLGKDMIKDVEFIK